MKVTTYKLLELQDDGTWGVVDEVFHYAEITGQCKKGRDIVSQNAKTGQNVATGNQSAAQGALALQQGALGEDLGSTTPGSLSPAATAQLASDRDQIANTYNGIRQTAFRTLGQRGMGSAPSGFAQTAENAADLGQATADTGAYRNAQVNTQNERNFATGQEGQIATSQGQLGNQALGQSTNAGVALNKMGSTAGDILGGVAELAPIVAAPFTGGASLLGSGIFGGTNPFSKMGKSGGSGVGSYGGATPNADSIG